MKRIEKKLLRQLKKYHRPSYIHSINVANDSKYIAKELGYSNLKIDKIYRAAILHDIGKLKMNHIILKEGVSNDEMKKILKNKSIKKNCDMRSYVTIEEIINSKTRYSPIKRYNLKKEMNGDLKKSLMHYIEEHEENTRKILTEHKIDKEIIEIASNHHNYGNRKTNGLTEKIHIVDIADKINAILQTEGKRKYIKSMSPAEAIRILGKNRKYNDHLLKTIAKKYIQEDFKKKNTQVKKKYKIDNIVSNVRQYLENQRDSIIRTAQNLLEQYQPLKSLVYAN